MKKVWKSLATVGFMTSLSIASCFMVFGKDDSAQWKEINNSWYYFNSDGSMLTGWQNIGGGWYFLEESGAMHIGWLQLNKTWYYMDEHGVMVTGDREIVNKNYSFHADGTLYGKDVTDYIGRYVDGFTLGHGSDRGYRVEIEKISDGYIWASIYMHDYGSGGTTIKGRLEGVKLENGVAGGAYKIARNDLDHIEGGTFKKVFDAGTFQIKLKNPSECLSEVWNDMSTYSPIAISYNNGKFEDFYFFEDKWDGEIVSWFMESESDLF